LIGDMTAEDPNSVEQGDNRTRHFRNVDFGMP